MPERVAGGGPHVASGCMKAERFSYQRLSLVLPERVAGGGPHELLPLTLVYNHLYINIFSFY